jgi:hypothetical protein
LQKFKLSDNQRWAPTKGKNERQSTPTINIQHQTIDNQEPTTIIDSGTRQPTVKHSTTEIRQPQQGTTTDRYTRQPTNTDTRQPTVDNQQPTTDTNKMQQDKIEINPFMLHRSRT